jgi:hypothetical protein
VFCKKFIAQEKAKEARLLSNPGQARAKIGRTISTRRHSVRKEAALARRGPLDRSRPEASAYSANGSFPFGYARKGLLVKARNGSN